MAFIEKRSKDRWRARYRGPDGVERSRTFGRRSDAEMFLTEVEHSKMRQTWVDPSKGRRTFGDFAAEWEATNLNLRPNTRAQYSSLLRCHLLPRFGDAKIASISPMDVRGFIAELAASELSPGTVRKCYRLLSLVMTAAEAMRLIARTPCVGVGLPQSPSQEMKFLTPEELEGLAQAITPRYRALVLAAGYSGARWGELAGLKPEKLNLLHGTLEIIETLIEVDGELSFGEPKTAKGRRTIALPRFLCDVLNEHLESHSKGSLVFTGADGAPLRRSNFNRRAWAPAVRKAGLDGLRFHDLRHTATSYLIAIGCHPHEISMRMGWSNIASMLQRYGHLLPSLDDRVRDGLETMRFGAAAASVRPERDLSRNVDAMIGDVS